MKPRCALHDLHNLRVGPAQRVVVVGCRAVEAKGQLHLLPRHPAHKEAEEDVRAVVEEELEADLIP